jgi:uncharacterized protein YjlB
MTGEGADVEARLMAEGLDPGRWSNGPNDRYAAHEHAYDKVLVVSAGTIAFYLAAQRDAVSLTPGDRLDLPAGTSHAALVGPTGVTCLEAHLSAGSLPGEPSRRAAGTW